jgi:hypothetical protein
LCCGCITILLGVYLSGIESCWNVCPIFSVVRILTVLPITATIPSGTCSEFNVAPYSSVSYDKGAMTECELKV